jgi:hypothetical protein
MQSERAPSINEILVALAFSKDMAIAAIPTEETIETLDATASIASLMLAGPGPNAATTPSPT